MAHDINSNMIYRYLTGEHTPDEVRKIEEWINSSEKNRETMQSLEKIWSVEPRKELKSDIDLAWKHLEERIDQREYTRVQEEKEVYRKPLRLRHQTTGTTGFRVNAWFGFAAIFILTTLGSLFTAIYLQDDTAEEQLSMNEVITERGQRAQIILDDGSRVRMNADSRITHLKEFGSDSRSVYLSGEAFFEVVPDERPFIVYADEVVVEILGTEFNVQAYEEEEIKVVVAGGRVAVRHQDSAEDQTVHLERGNMASLKQGGDNEIAVTLDVDLQRHLGWIEYRLEFDATPLDEVARRLERWYEMDIVIADQSISDLKFTAVFEDESIHEILESMELSLNLEYDIHGRQIRLFQTLEK